MTPPATHTAATPNGEPTVSATDAGTRKIPLPIVTPMTISVVSQKPRRRRSAAGAPGGADPGAADAADRAGSGLLETSVPMAAAAHEKSRYLTLQRNVHRAGQNARSR